MKKNIILLVTIMLYAISANCQLEKRNWLVGGSGSYSSTKYNSEAGQKNTYYELRASPNIGYFFFDKFSAGLKININNAGLKATGTTRWIQNVNLSTGPFARYYLLPADKEYNILTEGSYQFGYEGTNHLAKSSFSLAIGPVLYFNSSIGIEFLIGYSSQKFSAFAGRNNTVNFGIGLQAYLEKIK